MKIGFFNKQAPGHRRYYRHSNAGGGWHRR